MEKLSGIDRAYVGLESDDVPADFLSIVALDPSTAPDGHDYERFRAEAAARVVEVPALHRRTMAGPGIGMMIHCTSYAGQLPG